MNFQQNEESELENGMTFKSFRITTPTIESFERHIHTWMYSIKFDIAGRILSMLGYVHRAPEVWTENGKSYSMAFHEEHRHELAKRSLNYLIHLESTVEITVTKAINTYDDLLLSIPPARKHSNARHFFH